MAKVHRPARARPAAAATAGAPATRDHRDPGKALRVAGACCQREVKRVSGQCSTVVEVWTGKRWHCKHARQWNQCKECGGASFCEHGRVRSKCKVCGGAAIRFCEHGREQNQCKECGGTSMI